METTSRYDDDRARPRPGGRRCWTGDQKRPDLEVPERARRRTFTAQYKQDVLAAYETAPDGGKARSCAARACTPASFPSGAAPGTPGRWPG
jgi:hypothetical protein